MIMQEEMDSLHEIIVSKGSEGLHNFQIIPNELLKEVCEAYFICTKVSHYYLSD